MFSLNNWKKLSNLGITNNDKMIIYDNSDVLSACRCWYNFIFDLIHNHKCSDGGLKNGRQKIKVKIIFQK